MRNVCVMGGGPAGLAAAVFAARAGARVRLLERNDQCGKKLLITGGGHCNVGNVRPLSEWPELFGRKGRFIAPALAFLDGNGLAEWLAELGEPVRVRDGFHIYPKSNSARAVRDALVAAAKDVGVEIETHCRVNGLTVVDGTVRGVATATDCFACDAVVVTGGGKSFPGTGSTWDGVELAGACGHRVGDAFPGLVGLKAKGWTEELAGLVLPDAEVAFRGKGMDAARGRGELLLTHGGVSGPAVLDLSATVAQAAGKNGIAPLAVRWRGDMDAAAWRGQLDDWRRVSGAASLPSLMKKFLPLRLARWLCGFAGVHAETAVARLPVASRNRLVECLAGFPLTITGTEGWERAMITRGGVDVRDVDAKTMASRVVSGLFFAGEMLDVDGPCGGYNMHWAFASGALAGRAAGTT